MANAATPTARAKARSEEKKEEEVICLLDSSDEDDVGGVDGDGGDVEAETEFPVPADAALKAMAMCSPSNNSPASPQSPATAGTTAAPSSPLDASASPSSSRLSLGPFPSAVPDPRPAHDAEDFVLTPYGPGRVISSRIDRLPESDSSLLTPVLMYAIDLNAGVAHIPASDVRRIEGTAFAERRCLTYHGVGITEMDLLRLWPLTYLNDNLINFYLKYLTRTKFAAPPSKKLPSRPLGDSSASSQKDGAAGGVEGGDEGTDPGKKRTDTRRRRGGGGADDDIYVFPTYFYTRISYLEGGGTVYRNTKGQRRRMYEELKGWTKGVDIFTKKFLIFPIHYDLHWTSVLVCNPGHLLKLRPTPTPTPGVGPDDRCWAGRGWCPKGTPAVGGGDPGAKDGAKPPAEAPARPMTSKATSKADDRGLAGRGWAPKKGSTPAARWDVPGANGAKRPPAKPTTAKPTKASAPRESSKGAAAPTTAAKKTGSSSKPVASKTAAVPTMGQESERKPASGGKQKVVEASATLTATVTAAPMAMTNKKAPQKPFVPPEMLAAKTALEAEMSKRKSETKPQETMGMATVTALASNKNRQKPAEVPRSLEANTANTKRESEPNPLPKPAVQKGDSKGAVAAAAAAGCENLKKNESGNGATLEKIVVVDVTASNRQSKQKVDTPRANESCDDGPKCMKFSDPPEEPSRIRGGGGGFEEGDGRNADQQQPIPGSPGVADRAVMWQQLQQHAQLPSPVAQNPHLVRPGSAGISLQAMAAWPHLAEEAFVHQHAAAMMAMSAAPQPHPYWPMHVPQVMGQQPGHVGNHPFLEHVAVMRTAPSAASMVGMGIPANVAGAAVTEVVGEVPAAHVAAPAMVDLSVVPTDASVAQLGHPEAVARCRPVDLTSSDAEERSEGAVGSAAVAAAAAVQLAPRGGAKKKRKASAARTDGVPQQAKPADVSTYSKLQKEEATLEPSSAGSLQERKDSTLPTPILKKATPRGKKSKSTNKGTHDAHPSAKPLTSEAAPSANDPPAKTKKQRTNAISVTRAIPSAEARAKTTLLSQQGQRELDISAGCDGATSLKSVSKAKSDSVQISSAKVSLVSATHATTSSLSTHAKNNLQKPTMNPPDKVREDPNADLAPCMIHLDSGKVFKLHKSTTIFSHIRKYLAACYEAAVSEADPDRVKHVIQMKSFPGMTVAVPQQENARDCGVYMLEMVERVMEHPPEVDRQFVERRGKAEGRRYFRTDWFGKHVTDKKRTEMLSLVRKLQQENKTVML